MKPLSWLAPAAPLVPGADDARSDLRRELLRPEYHDQDVVDQVITWIQRRLEGLLDATSQAPSLSTFFALVVLVALLVALGLLISRARVTARATQERRAVLTDEVVSAAELRARAEAALAAGRHRDAVVDGFRALTVRQVETGRLPDQPGATAHEVAGSLAADRPDQGADLSACADLFDLVLYGDRPASSEEAEAVLALDDVLSGRRVAR